MLIFQETVCVMYLYVIMIYLYKYIITLLSPSHLPGIGTHPSRQSGDILCKVQV